jgi:hypothetical protein
VLEAGAVTLPCGPERRGIGDGIGLSVLPWGGLAAAGPAQPRPTAALVPTAFRARGRQKQGIFESMQARKIHVENGRIKLDEPTSLPDGAEVELVILSGDELDDDERARLYASLDRAIDDEDAGRVVDADEVLAEVRADT